MRSRLRAVAGAQRLLVLALLMLGCSSYEDGLADEGDAAVAPADGEAPPANHLNNPTVDPSQTPKTLPAIFALDDVISLHVPKGGTWQEKSSSTTLKGNLTLAAGAYLFPLGNALVNIVGNQRSPTSVSGTAAVSMPVLHTFSGLGLNSPLSAVLGYDYGSNLSSLGLPLAATRRYFYFTFTNGFSSSFGTGPFSSNLSATRTVVIDPNDPSIYFAGPMGPLSAIALSEKSLIPFTAQTTFGFDTPGADFPSFTGQSFEAGEVSLEEFPVTVSGAVTTQFAGWDGKSILDKTLFDHTVGVNGSFNLGWDFADGLFRLEVPLAKASLYASTSGHPYKAELAVSGTAGTKTFLPSWMPVLLGDNSSIAGYVNTSDSAKNHIDGSSVMTLNASSLSSVIGLTMRDLTLAQSTFHADKIGFRFRGISSMGLTPDLVSSSCIITACFGGDPIACLSDDQTGTPVVGSKDWVIRMEGDVTVASVPLVTATALAMPKGLSVEAYLKTPVAQASLKGSITPAGSGHVPNILLTGSASVHMELNEVNQVVQAVANGALCGYQQITSAAKCGSNVLKFADSLHCGKPHCSWSWRHGLRCSPLDCSVSIPKTCDDVGKPKTCKAMAPKFNLGSVTGSVAITLDNQGIRGAGLYGTFCSAGNCSTVSNVGKVDFSSVNNPRICIDASELSAGLAPGKYCADF